MEITSSTNSTLAISAYQSQQQPAVRNSGRGDEFAGSKPSDSAPKGNEVTFSEQALALSTQPNRNAQAVNSVQPAEESAAADEQGRQSPDPQQAQIAGAKSIAQAINAYLNTSLI